MITGACRRVLQSDKSTMPEEIPIVVKGKPLMVSGADGKKRLFKVGNDGTRRTDICMFQMRKSINRLCATMVSR